MIRYHLTDKLALRRKLERDIKGFSRADVLLCRDKDVLWFEKENANKEFLHLLSIEGLCVNGLLDYQFVQTSQKTFKI